MRFLPFALGAAVCAALLTASPVDAQSSRKQRNNDDRWYRTQNSQSGRTPDIYVGGKNMGTDPDPRVRASIQRDIGAVYPGPD